jgi:hypothetical protein
MFWTQVPKIMGELAFAIVCFHFMFSWFNIADKFHLTPYRAVGEGVCDMICLAMFLLMVDLVQRHADSVSDIVAQTLILVIYCFLILFVLRVVLICAHLDSSSTSKNSNSLSQAP